VSVLEVPHEAPHKKQQGSQTQHDAEEARGNEPLCRGDPGVAAALHWHGDGEPRAVERVGKIDAVLPFRGHRERARRHRNGAGFHLVQEGFELRGLDPIVQVQCARDFSPEVDGDSAELAISVNHEGWCDLGSDGQ
jgi:hypothetical protein